MKCADTVNYAEDIISPVHVFNTKGTVAFFMRFAVLKDNYGADSVLSLVV